MIIHELTRLFIRDLEKLRNEISLYKNSDKIWATDKAIANSAGNLCLHLAGNLKSYIGKAVGGFDYVRDRDLEFSAKHVPLSVLLVQIDETIIVVRQSLEHLAEPDLEKDFPVVIWEKPANMAYTLFHLLSHLNYHLGQVNYHRRLLDEESKTD